MRTSVLTAAAAYSSDEELTTGEAAKLLNCSRQHVVDLCNEGLLPYTTVGTHRRVQRRDVEAVRTRTDRLSRDERRALWLAYTVAGKIVADPESARRSATNSCVAWSRRCAVRHANGWPSGLAC